MQLLLQVNNVFKCAFFDQNFIIGGYSALSVCQLPQKSHFPTDLHFPSHATELIPDFPNSHPYKVDLLQPNTSPTCTSVGCRKKPECQGETNVVKESEQTSHGQHRRSESTPGCWSCETVVIPATPMVTKGAFNAFCYISIVGKLLY